MSSERTDADLREALRISEERYRHLVENASELIYRTDANGRFTYANPAALRITCYAEDELLGMRWLDLVDKEGRKAAEHFYGHQLTSRTPSTYFELPVVTKYGKRLWVGQNVQLLVEADTVVGFEVVARDVTSRVEMEAEIARACDEAIQASRSKSEFLANMSHEIRTPLNGVLGMAGLLLTTPLTPEQREYSEAIRSSGEALLAVVNDVLDLAKVEAGKLSIQEADFDLDDLLDGISDIFGERAAAKRLRLRINVQPEVYTRLRGDAHRIRQVLLNLVGNALKFTERGDVTLSVTQRESSANDLVLWFVVTDTGIGIPPAAQRRLFTPFMQADGSTTRKYGGSGLGLAVSKQLVEAMNGEIGMASIHGEGSTFWFTLPLRKQPPGAQSPKRKWDLSLFRALVVDSHEVNRIVLTRHLSSTAIRIAEEETAAAALARLAEEKFDIVLCDMQLPDEDGLTFARAVQQIAGTEATRLVLLTSYGRRRSDAATFRAAGYDSFLVKPVRRAHVCNTVARLLLAATVPTEHDLGDVEPMAAHRGRVLLVEDNPVNQLVALGQLRRIGYDCTVAGSGAEALDILKSETFDLIFMDGQMPEMDGYEATRTIRSQGIRTPIVALTAHALEGEREKCIGAGMDDYLPKPVSQEQIAAMMAKWLGAPAPVSDPATTATSPMLRIADDDDVLDRERIDSYLEISQKHAGFLGGLVETFRLDFPLRLDALRSAVERGDALELADAAHAVKSSTGSVGARQMHELATALERAAREGRLDGANESIARLVSAYERTNAAFAEIV